MPVIEKTGRFNFDVPGWNAEWQEWQRIFRGMAQNFDATMFAIMEAGKLILKDLPTVEIVEVTPGNYQLQADTVARFLSRTFQTEIVIGPGNVSLLPDSFLVIPFVPGAVNQKMQSFEVIQGGMPIDAGMIPVGYVRSNYTIFWYNGAYLPIGTPTLLFSHGSGGGGGGGEGYRWNAVISIVDCTQPPPTEITGDRYILDDTAGTVHADWDGANKLDVVEFGVYSWTAQTPTEGVVTYVSTSAKDALFTELPSAWTLRDTGGGGGYNFDSVVIVEAGGSPALNATNLLNGYAAAKLLTPGGNALSAYNRAIVIVPPGEYDLGGVSLDIDTDYVDIMGMGSGAGRGINTGSPYLTGTEGNVIKWTANDARLSNFHIHQGVIENVAIDFSDPIYGGAQSVIDRVLFVGSTPTRYAVGSSAGAVNATFLDCQAGPGFIIGCYFGGAAYRCSAGDGSFGGNHGTVYGSGTIEFTGYAEDCVAGMYSFCSAWDGQALLSGTLVRCKAGDQSFCVSTGSLVGYGAEMSGVIRDCVGENNSLCYSTIGNAVMSGLIERCSAGSGVFCASGHPGWLAHLTGEIYDCRALSICFGGSGIAPFTNAQVSGRVVNCRAGSISVPGARSFGALGGMNGVLERCYTNGTECFGNVTGKMFDCQNDGGVSLVKVGANAQLHGCRFRSTTGSVIMLTGSGALIQHCDLYAADKSVSIITDGEFIMTATIALCSMNTDIAEEIQNSIGAGYNAVTAYVPWTPPE